MNKLATEDTVEKVAINIEAAHKWLSDAQPPRRTEAERTLCINKALAHLNLARAAINAMSDELLRLVQHAYEEGVEDGMEAAAAPHLRDVAVPQWIDSVARVELLKFAALESLSGGGGE